jgi:hypothetical protein
MRELRKGDKVKFLNDIGEAEVIDVLPNGKVLLEDENGFDIEVRSRELLLVNIDEQDLYNNKLPDISEILDLEIDEKKRKAIEENFQQKYSNIQQVNSKRGGEHWLVDLHFHELVDHVSDFTDKAKLDIQLNHFERMMKMAAEQKVRKVIFIHGVGQGVLRHQLRSRLEMYYPECSVRDANPREFGAGASEVIISQSAF